MLAVSLTQRRAAGVVQAGWCVRAAHPVTSYWCKRGLGVARPGMWPGTTGDLDSPRTAVSSLISAAVPLVARAPDLYPSGSRAQWDFLERAIAAEGRIEALMAKISAEAPDR